MKIRTKFLGIIYIIILIFGLSILGIYFYLHTHTSKSINNILSCNNELEILSQLELALIKTVMPANDYLIHGNKEEKYTFEELDANVNNYFSMLEGKTFPTFITMEGREIFEKLKGQYVQIKTFSAIIFNLPNPIGNTEGAHIMEKLDLLMDNMLDDMKKLHDRSRRDVLIEVEAINDHFYRYMIIVLSAFGVITVVLILYGLFLVQGIISHIERLAEHMKFVAKGGSGKKLDIKSNDEIGYLANSFNGMAFRLEESRRQLQD
ncbi:MAG: HAMP domain-containing protein, partial [Candidatus Scalindua sp.]|nr:HAMP domain-containing protein [Candidatus Scalindua sp.]MCR4345485.1 HAMP domain-containing protein [Candidatus Scalindua sp.]